MPSPCRYDDRASFMEACVSARQDEDPSEDTDQSVAACLSIWRNRDCGEKSMSDSKRIVKAGHLEHSDGVTARFVASTSVIDRMGDIVEQDWVDMETFMSNPVLAFAHDTGILPVGRVKAWETRNTKSFADTERVPAGINQLADEVWEYVKLGFLNAVSVGFTSADVNPRFDSKGEYIGLRFRKNRLHELSIVPVPANQEALAVARGMNIPAANLKKLFSSHPVSEPGLPAGYSVYEARQLIEKYKSRST